MTTPRILLMILASTVGAGLDAADAETNWKERCAKCHGEDGRGETKMGRKLGIADLAAATVQAKFTDDAAFNAVKAGVTDATGKTTMKPIEGLADEEIKALVAYVRALKK